MVNVIISQLAQFEYSIIVLCDACDHTEVLFKSHWNKHHNAKATILVLLSFCLGHMHSAVLHIWNTFQRYFNEFRKYTIELEDPVIMAGNYIVDSGASKA